MKNSREGSRGFITILLLIVLGLIILGYFHVSIKDTLESPAVKQNLSYAWTLVKELWANWLRTPAIWVWDHVVKFFWQLLWNGIQGLKDGHGPSTLMQSGATVK